MAEPLPPGPAFIAGPYCRDCRSVGLLHCGSEAAYCGGTPPMPGYIWRPATDHTMSGWVRPSGGERENSP